MPSQSASRKARTARLAEIQKQHERAERRRLAAWWGVGVVVVGGLIALVAVTIAGSGSSKDGSSTPPGAFPVQQVNAADTATTAGQPIQTTSPAPKAETAIWGLPIDASPYIAAAGLSALPNETLAVHYHAHLDMYVNGSRVLLPQYVGMVIKNNSVTALAPVHTHATDGVIHIESPINKKFVLGQVFTEWGVRLTKSCIGGYCSGNGKVLKIYVNGKPYTGDPQKLVMLRHQEIAVWYGDSTETPKVPSSYSFPGGL